MSRELNADQDNAFLEIGKIIEDSFYKRENRNLNIGNMKIDLIKKNGEDILICEVKKSSRYEKPSIMQVAFYLMKLEENGLIVKGEILIPTERKKILVELTDDIKEELRRAIFEIEKIIVLGKPPEKEKNRFCTHCAYREFCWS